MVQPAAAVGIRQRARLLISLLGILGLLTDLNLDLLRGVVRKMNSAGRAGTIMIQPPQMSNRLGQGTTNSKRSGCYQREAPHTLVRGLISVVISITNQWLEMALYQV